MRSIPRFAANRDLTQLRPASYPRTLVFHKVRAGFSYGSTNFSPERFVELIHYLQEQGYHFARPWEEVQNETTLALTFDDGYAHLVPVLNWLLEQRIPPTVFLPTALLGKTNSWDYSSFISPQRHMSRGEVLELARRGVEFGSHGHEHIDLTGMNTIGLKQELQRSQAVLSDLIGRPARALSYPFGRATVPVLRAAELAGFTTAFTMRFPEPDDLPLAMGRIPVYGFDTIFSVRAKLSYGPLRFVEAVKTRVTNGLSGGTVLLNRLRPSAR